MSSTSAAPEPLAAELHATFTQFLRALGDPDAGETLHRLHTGDAVLRHDGGLLPAAQVEPALYAASHRELSLTGTDHYPDLEQATLLHATLDEAALELVAWFEVLERRAQHRIMLAVGLRREQTSLRLGWCTLAKQTGRWSYRDGYAQSLADYPWMRKGVPAPARVLLDASYFRHHWRAPVTFNTLPDARFSCQMSAACCKHDYEITLPPEAQLLIEALPWPTLAPALAGTRLPVREDGKLQLKEINETCRFLGARHQCLIHQHLGQQPFGACAVFPFSFADTPDGIAVSLSPICGSTRLGVGIAPRDREDDLRERLVHTEPRHTNTYRLAPDVEIPWHVFRDIEKGLRDCLAADEVPLRQRLHVAARLLGACRRNEPIDAQAWLSEPPVEVMPELREAIRGMLAKVLGWDRTVLRSLPRTVPEELFKREAHDAPIVVRILHNVQFSKIYSYPYDLTTGHNFVIVLYLMTLVLQAASSGPLSDAMWQELGSLGVHGFLKNILHEGVPEGFRALFGTSEFGLWMLAA
jgi:Fe-S-cluster containining protein